MNMTVDNLKNIQGFLLLLKLMYMIVFFIIIIIIIICFVCSPFVNWPVLTIGTCTPVSAHS